MYREVFQQPSENSDCDKKKSKIKCEKGKSFESRRWKNPVFSLSSPLKMLIRFYCDFYKAFIFRQKDKNSERKKFREFEDELVETSGFFTIMIMLSIGIKSRFDRGLLTVSTTLSNSLVFLSVKFRSTEQKSHLSSLVEAGFTLLTDGILFSNWSVSSSTFAACCYEK